MPFLGPIFNIEASNRYNYEKTCNEILDEIMLFSEKIGYDYFSIIHVPEIKDVRAYKHRGFSFTQLYTYLFNLQNGQDRIFGNFHRPARNILQKAHNNNQLSISHDPTFAIVILELLKLRYAEQSLKFKITKDYFNSLTGNTIKDNIEVISLVALVTVHPLMNIIILIFQFNRGYYNTNQRIFFTESEFLNYNRNIQNSAKRLINQGF